MHMHQRNIVSLVLVSEYVRLLFFSVVTVLCLLSGEGKGIQWRRIWSASKRTTRSNMYRRTRSIASGAPSEPWSIVDADGRSLLTDSRPLAQSAARITQSLSGATKLFVPSAARRIAKQKKGSPTFRASFLGVPFLRVGSNTNHAISVCVDRHDCAVESRAWQQAMAPTRGCCYPLTFREEAFWETRNLLFTALISEITRSGPSIGKGAREVRCYSVLLPVWWVLRKRVTTPASPSGEIVILHASTRFASYPQRVDALRLPDARQRASAQLRSKEPVDSLLVCAAPP